MGRCEGDSEENDSQVSRLAVGVGVLSSGARSSCSGQMEEPISGRVGVSGPCRELVPGRRTTSAAKAAAIPTDSGEQFWEGLRQCPISVSEVAGGRGRDGRVSTGLLFCSWDTPQLMNKLCCHAPG